MRIWTVLLIVGLTLGVGVSSPGPAWGIDDDHKAPGGEEHKGSADHKAEPEKMDLFKGWLDLTIWTIVVFLVLFFVLSKFAWPQIAEGLDRREANIALAKEEADAAKAEATRLREQLQAEMARAHEQVRQMIEKARVDAEAAAAEQLAKGKADLQVERERLNRELTTSRDQALQEIWNQAAQVATLISSKVIKRNLTPEDHRELVDEALGEFRAAAEERNRDYLGTRA